MLKYIKLFILLMLLSPAILGQKLINSPYSRFGPGTIEQQGILRSRSMGGTGIALRDPVSINYLNPASYSSIDTNSFVFDFGLEYQANILKNAGSSHLSDDINFHHFAMAVPLSKRMGVAIGIVPYSNGYYNLMETITDTDPDYDPLLGEIQNNHKGSGSYNKFFLGIGISPIKNLSVGANLTFLFGEIERDNYYFFLDDNNQFNNHSSEDILIKGFNIDYGIQYTAFFKNDFFATAGFTLSMKKNYNSEYLKLFSRYTDYQGSSYSVDTLEYVNNPDASITLPQTMGFGLAFGKEGSFILSTDYSITNWEQSSFLGYESYFVKSKSIHFGGEYIPNKYANYNYLNRVEYRLGGHISNGHLMVKEEQLKEFGITFGAGLPMNRTKSRINLHLEYTSRKGSFDNSLHNENYYTVGVSLNLYDYWFNKRKYN